MGHKSKLPIQHYQIFADLPSKSSRVWRYFELWKFERLLESRGLWFSRVSLFNEPYESSLPEGMIRDWRIAIDRYESDGSPESTAKAKNLEERILGLRRASYIAANTFFANCWNLKKCESDAMWRLYVPSGKGVVVETSVTRFVRCLQMAGYDQPMDVRRPCDQTMYVNKLSYCDYANLDFRGKDGGFHIANYVFHKRSNFDHERELRAAIWRPDLLTPVIQSTGQLPEAFPEGMLVRVDLNKLVRNIFVYDRGGPNHDFLNEIESRVRAAGLKTPVFNSAMTAPPVPFQPPT